MSKRGRRRNSRRKSSSSSKQSASPYIFLKQNKNGTGYKDDAVEKGESDSMRRENVGAASDDDEERYDNSAPQEKRYKPDRRPTFALNQRSVYAKTTEDKETGTKIVTSVSVDDLDGSAPKVTFRQRREPSSDEKRTRSSSTPVTNVMKIDCSASGVKLEIQEILDGSDVKTTFVFVNGNAGGARATTATTMPDNESPERPSLLNACDRGADQNYRFSFGGVRDRADGPTKTWYNPNCPCYAGQQQEIATDCSSANPPPGSALQLNIKPQEKRKYFQKSFSIDQFWDIPPPQEFADIKYNTLEELRFDLASARIGTSPTFKREFHTLPDLTHDEESAEEQADLAPSFDQLSESDNYDPSLARPSVSTNRSSFTREFVSLQKRKSWIRNNSIAAVEHRACPYLQKRRQTFPGIMSEGLELMQEDLLLPCTESFSSVIMCSCPERTETPGTVQQTDDDNFPDDSTEPSNRYDGTRAILGSFCTIGSEDNPDAGFTVCGQSRRQSSVRCGHPGFKQSSCKCVDSLDTEVADSGFEQEIREVEFQSGDGVADEPGRRTFAIQVIPPSCSGSEEQMLPSHQVPLFQNDPEDSDSTPTEHKSSVVTLTVGSLEQRFLQMDLRSSQSARKENSLGSSLEDIGGCPFQGGDVKAVTAREVEVESGSEAAAGEEPGDTRTSRPLTTLETKDRRRGARRSTPTELHVKEQLGKTNKSNKPTVSRCSSEVIDHLKPVMHGESESGGGGGSSEHWAKRRKLFKDSKQWSSAGGSSITSDITEESVSEDTPSMDMTTRDSEEGGFYMETFHSAAWIYQGDSAEVISPSLSARTPAVAIRERTVKINKGSGEYPWGFRIQFSKPITVTEVDTNGAAEEAGLTVGDYVLAVNGIDVTSIPHSEAADLARQGPDILTLTIGSDIGRGPNTPRPACRGYLHKRTQSGLIKGWRKRWFVLTHDCCLCYYRHKRDEGKRRALSAVKLEGAEVGQDSTLGKPFVFRCRPQALNRVFFFCATSNQEMKRWLEAMQRAVHPIAQNHVWVDVTRHNSNLPPLAVKNPECLGLLHKMDKNKDTWLQHYCILKDGCLYLYSGIRATHAHGGIYLQGYSVKEQPYAFKKSTIELKPLSDEFKTFHLCAENPTENKRWIVAIKASIKKWLPLHRALQEYMNRPAEETRM